MQQIHTSPFFVLNGDVLLANFSLREMFKCFHQEMVGLLLSVWVDDIRPYGEIASDGIGKIQEFREKQPIRRPGYINGAVYIFNRTIAEAFPKNRDIFSIERDVFPNVSNLYTLRAVEDAVIRANGTLILNRCGHSFIKTRMQEMDAFFAGEASRHYYFRDNFYADNGMIPFLFVLENLCAKRRSLLEWVASLRAAYPVSGLFYC